MPWRLDADDALSVPALPAFLRAKLVELGCFIALTMGQQSSLRLLDIEHHEVLAGTDASMAAPGFATRGAGRVQGVPGLLGTQAGQELTRLGVRTP